MKSKSLRQGIIVFILIAFVASTVWTYFSIRSKTVEPAEDIVLEVIPEYQITSGKKLIVWSEGTVFEQGMASYFYAAKPIVTISPLIKISGMEQGNVSGTIRSEVTLQALDDKYQPYWSYLLKTTPVQSFNLSHGISGQTDQETFTAGIILLDTVASYDLVTRISNELMFQTGVFQLLVTTNVSLSGTANGISIDKTVVQELPLTLQLVSFSIPRSQDSAAQVSLYTGESMTNFSQQLKDIAIDNPVQILITLILLFLFLLLLVINNGGKPKTAIEHRRYREWITEGSVEVKDKYLIHIFSLEGLVDLAIDLNKRVIFDPRIKKYYVLTEELVYVYDSEQTLAILNNRQQLGKLLLERGLLKPEQLEIGLYYQRKIGSRLGESLIALGFIDETTLYSTLAEQQKVDYYELDPRKEVFNIDWLEKLSIQRARALMIIPLGNRDDDRLVIACAQVSQEGFQDTLEEIFGEKVYIVAARPSAIYEALERIERQHNSKSSNGEMISGKVQEPVNRLSEEEQKQFLLSYLRGKLLHGMLLKASGITDAAILTQVPEQEPLLNWLVNKNFINGETSNLIKGLDKAIDAMEWNTRQEKQVPTILELLQNANYLTTQTAQWVTREHLLQNLPTEQLLRNNFLASVETIKRAGMLLSTLESILINQR